MSNWKDTVMSDEQLNRIWNVIHKQVGNRLGYIAQAQAEISFKAGIKEVVKWLQEYAIHGGEIPLKSVLEDIETHSPFMMSQAKRMGDYTRRR